MAENSDDVPVQQRSAATPDDILVQIQLSENGSARWRLEYRFFFNDSDQVSAFESYHDALAENRSAYRSRFAGGMRRVAADAENRTGRSMAISNVTIETNRRRVPSFHGVIVYRFTWHGFAATDGNRLRAGDALSEFFLTEEDTTLLISWPDRYSLTRAVPPPDERRANAVIWNGPIEFAPNEPLLVLTKPEDGPSAATVLAVTIAGIIVVIGVILLAWRRGHLDGLDDTVRDRLSIFDHGSESGPELDSELLTNEEQVLELVDAHGGRVKQQAVVTELEWSETKTSDVIGALHEQGDLDVLRIGRENVLSLPEDDGGDATDNGH